MKFTIEVEDFWLEEEELNEALQAHLLSSVTHKISESIKDKVDKEISAKVTKTIEKSLLPLIDIELTKLIETGIITPNSKEITISEHIKNMFHNSRNWNSPKDQIERFSKRFCAELKLQYDAAFATKIVMGMKDQGLLKPEVVQMLLEDNGKN